MVRLSGSVCLVWRPGMLQRKKDLISGPALHSTYAVQTFQKNSVQGRFGVCETKRYGSVYDYSRAQLNLLEKHLAAQ